MNMLHRAVHNGSVLFLAQVVTWSASLVLFAALARNLGAAGFGTLTLAITLVTLLGIFVEFGLDQQVVRAVARDGGVAGRLLVAAIAIKAATALVAYGVLLLLVAALGYGDDLRDVSVVYGAMLFLTAASSSLNTVYQGGQRMSHVAIGAVVEKAFDASAVIALFALGAGVVAVSGALVVGAVLGVLWKASFLPRTVPLRPAVERGSFVALVRGAPPFLLYGILGSFYYRIDTVLLAKLTDATVVGWYGAAYRLFDTLVFLPSIVSAAVMFPILAKLSSVSGAELRVALGKGLTTILILGVPIAVGMFVLADGIISLVYGSAFGPSVDALRWLAPGLLFLYVNSILTVAIIALDRERRMVTLAAVCCVLNVGLNLALIPVYRHVGAAAVTTITELFICAFLLRAVPRDLITPDVTVVLRKTVLASAAMALALELLHDQHLVALVVVGMVVYAVAALALRVVPASDFAAVHQAVRAMGRRGLRAEETRG